jgi:hypothetical protein
VEDVVDANEYLGPGRTVGIKRTNIGDNVEGTEPRLRPQMSAATYPGTHNPGHMFASVLSEENDSGERVGVMSIPRTAIRDPRSSLLALAHRRPQPRRAGGADARRVRVGRADGHVRNSIGGGATRWASPDVILCWTADVPGHDAPSFVETGGQQLGEQAFGGLPGTRASPTPRCGCRTARRAAPPPVWGPS